jgi:hypothetical protein
MLPTMEHPARLGMARQRNIPSMIRLDCGASTDEQEALLAILRKVSTPPES